MKRRRPPTDKFPPDLRVVKPGDEKDAELRRTSARGGKMNQKQADHVLDLAAQFCGPVEIMRRLEAHEDPSLRVKLSSQGIGQYIKRHIDQVEKRRKRYMSDLSATPLAFKRYRLSQLQEIIDGCRNDAGVIVDAPQMLDALKVAAWEMNRFGLFDRELGSGEADVKEAEDFLAKIGVGRIAGEKVLRRKS